MCDHEGIRGESGTMVPVIVPNTEVIVAEAMTMTDVDVTKAVTVATAAVIGMPAETV